jgi:hypothetical protein
MRVDNVTFTDATDFAVLVYDVLRGAGGHGSVRGDSYPLGWVLRAYEQVGLTPFADRLPRAVAGCLTAAEPFVRAQALTFFQAYPHAAGGERVADLVAGDRTLFAGVADPVHPGVDLEWQLLMALAARLAGGDDDAIPATPLA